MNEEIVQLVQSAQSFLRIANNIWSIGVIFIVVCIPLEIIFFHLSRKRQIKRKPR